MTVTKSITISDSRDARQKTLNLLAADATRRELRVIKHETHPISELILCCRTCTAIPSEEAKQLVQALSHMPGHRSFSGEACHTGGYIGNNIWGSGFYKPAVYCQCCGYAMSGPEINHVTIVKSEDDEWNAAMVAQCEFGAAWHNGINYGMTYGMESA